MATVVSSNVVTCPSCGAQGIVRVWACGCQEVVAASHHPSCLNKAHFSLYVRHCDSRSEDLRSH